MAKYHGKVSVFKIDDSGSTLQDLSNFVSDVSLDLGQDVAEATAKGSAAKEYTVGHHGATASFTGRWDDTATTGPDDILRTLVTGGAASDVEISFGGDGSGQRRVSGSMIVTQYAVSSPLAGTVDFTGAGTFTGAITFDANV